LRSAHAARSIHPFLQHTTDNYRPLAKQQLTAPRHAAGSMRLGAVTAYVAIPTAIRIAFLPSFAVNSTPCRHSGGRNRDFGPVGHEQPGLSAAS
jgi:hypothetical protein